MADNNTLNFDLDAPAVPTLTLDPAADEKVAVYTAGCFDIGKVTVSASYTITESDKDNLRMRGIVFKAAAAAN